MGKNPLRTRFWVERTLEPRRLSTVPKMHIHEWAHRPSHATIRSKNPASIEAGLIGVSCHTLEEEFQSQLQNARIVGGANLRESGGQDVVIPRAASAACISGNTSPFGVIEDVEGFRAKFEGGAFFDP